MPTINQLKQERNRILRLMSAVIQAGYIDSEGIKNGRKRIQEIDVELKELEKDIKKHVVSESTMNSSARN